MRNILKMTAANWRKVVAGGLFTASLAALVLASFLAGPAMADADPESNCCICDCGVDATTSGIPEGAVCREASNNLDCNDICADLGCPVDQLADQSCDEIAACAPSDSTRTTMAPAASPIAMAGLAFLLAYLGVRTLAVR